MLTFQPNTNTTRVYIAWIPFKLNSPAYAINLKFYMNICCVTCSIIIKSSWYFAFNYLILWYRDRICLVVFYLKYDILDNLRKKSAFCMEFTVKLTCLMQQNQLRWNCSHCNLISCIIVLYLLCVHYKVFVLIHVYVVAAVISDQSANLREANLFQLLCLRCNFNTQSIGRARG